MIEPTPKINFVGIAYCFWPKIILAIYTLQYCNFIESPGFI